MWTSDNKWLPSSERGQRVFKWTVWVATPIVAAFIIVLGMQFGWKH